LRTVFLGTSEFAAAILRALAGGPHRPALVVTRPDRPQGRGRRLAAPPVAEAAADLALPLDQPESVNSAQARARIARASPEAVCVCAFGALITEPLLSEYPMLNVHPSLLPRWRGAAPIERAIMAGDERSGVSIMRLTAGLDSGPVCAQAMEPVAPDDTYGTLAERLERAGARLLAEVLDAMPACHEQDDTGVTYAEKITAEVRRLDPGRSAVELERTVRALHPHIGAVLELPGGERLGVHAARALSASPGATAHGGAPAHPGDLSLDGSRPVLACAEGVLELLTVQPPGRRAMSGEDYVRGRRGAARR
jgi:methionyl-tRNA formyltransferase